MLIDLVDKQRISLDGIREEGGAERHVKFNIDFDEWRRYRPYPQPKNKKFCFARWDRRFFPHTQITSQTQTWQNNK